MLKQLPQSLRIPGGGRAVAKFVLGWGNAISGGVVALGTEIIGRDAVAYFIDDKSIDKVKEGFENTKET